MSNNRLAKIMKVSTPNAVFQCNIHSMEETTNVNLDRSSIILSRSARLLAKNESDKARKRPITIFSVHRLFACQCLSAAGIRGKARAQAYLKNILVGAQGNCSDSHPISPRDVATALLSSPHTHTQNHAAQATIFSPLHQ